MLMNELFFIVLWLAVDTSFFRQFTTVQILRKNIGGKEKGKKKTEPILI